MPWRTTIDRWARKLGYVRAYAAGRVDRLTSDWVWQPLSANTDIRPTLRTMRARARQLAQDNDYAKKFLTMVAVNVAGPQGVTFQSKVAYPSGEQDQLANQLIETAFTRWSRKGQCDVTGQLSRTDAERLFVTSVARDGEVLVRKVKGFANPFRFALQFLEADHLDETLTVAELPTGNRIVMGVEFNAWKRPVAYHLLTEHPGDFPFTYKGRLYERVPAGEIIHAFLLDRVGQARGVPWMHTAMTRMNMLGGYEEAELVAARTGACKMGFFTTPTGEEYVGDDTDNKGNLISEAEPATFEQLPTGTDFKSFMPEHPSGTYDKFVKSCLRGIAAGLGVSYNALAEDLEGVNYSSIRAGLLSERDLWRLCQGWMLESFHQVYFADWLEMALLTQQIPLPPSKFAKFNQPKFQPRGWAWVDPKNDQEGHILAIGQGLNTKTEILAEQGRDLENTFAQLAEEQKLERAYGLTFGPLAKTAPPPAPEGNV